MQTLRKKTSPLKYKNETSRFLGEGVSFKAKLIGILEVSEARGDRMCQEALADLKMAIRAAGEHKQRITINIAIDGLRLRDEKTGDSLYHHPVHKISFIAQDMSDSRAFGYIFGSPDTGHRFFGIKTDKAASQVVIAMRDLFQVVFALKKKEIELAKQHLDKSRYTNTSLFSESAQAATKLQTVVQDSTKTAAETKSAEETKTSGAAVADLVDLELELNHLQQGLTQMERITPSDPFGSKDDPFGDSFISYPKQPILPPPPSGRERNREIKSTESDVSTTKIFDFQPDFNASLDEHKSDWFATPPPGVDEAKPAPPDQHEAKKLEILSQFDVFTELDPLGTGKIKPYVDKKHFFQELKNPPKKVLNDLVTQTTQEPLNTLEQKPNNLFKNNVFDNDPFGEDPFKEDPFAETDFLKQDPFNTDNCDLKILTGTTLFNNIKTTQNFSFQTTTEAPAPPPRPVATNFVQIEPPPLPPKKVKPPPRPPHHEEIKNEMNVEFPSTEVSPPLPLPQRRPKLEWPPKQAGSDEDYLTPISVEEPKPFEEDLDGLDITLSQLTLSGLNELAAKLNIPASQLSNMTLAQLTSYLSNFIKNKRKMATSDTTAAPTESFKADFAANFATTTEQYDRYAAFRDLFKEETKSTTEAAEPATKDEESVEEKKINNTDIVVSKEDRYAALREIVELEFKDNVSEVNENVKNDDVLLENETNIFKTTKEMEEKVKDDDIIKYTPPLNIIQEADKSPVSETAIKSPAVSEITQKTAHPTSGSLSDVISGSSPEIDNTGSASEIVKKTTDAAGESWAIFDQANLNQEENNNNNNNNKPTTTQSEEGVSPWSSDSKEFGNGSPPGWRHRQDSSSCGEHHYNRRRAHRDQETWWDTSAEPELNYYPTNRHSTDSYEDECFNYYDRPPPYHRRQIGRHLESGGVVGGHSSSSRDVSPLDDEQSRRDPRELQPSWRRHQDTFGRRRERDRRRTDSWDEEDDFDYEEDHGRPPHWAEHYRRELERERSSREHEPEREDERKYRRRRENAKCCCPDRELDFQGARYNSGRFSAPDTIPVRRHDKKHEEYYYSRDSQESLWDDEYSNEREDSYLHYVTAKRNWKRPSSASEMERKAAERTRQPYMTTGGSDGERERKYKPNRRSRSRDSQYSDTTYNRHKPEPGPPLRRPKQQHPHKPYDPPPKLEPALGPKKFNKLRQESLPATLPRKTAARASFESDFVPSEGDSPVVTRPVKRFTFDTDFDTPAVKPFEKDLTPKQKSLFEDDFIPTTERPALDTSTISSIKEEGAEDDTMGRLEKRLSQKRVFAGKNRFSNLDVNLKKSESVNIFARESDPFDDDFFSEGAAGGEHKWSENFDEFGDDERI